MHGYRTNYYKIFCSGGSAMKLVRICMYVSLIFFTLLPCRITGTGDYEHKIVYYVALGDNIAKGYGLKDVKNESYVGRIAQSLEDKYGAVHLTNFGENGLRSEQLLKRLTDEDEEQHEAYMEAIRKADLITLSIGSNDLLQYLSLKTDFSEFRKHGDEIFTKACEQFGDNIPKIIEIIHRQAPQAQLFVNNIYNPCNDSSFNISESVVKNLEELAEKYIERMNQGFETKEVQSVFHSMNPAEKESEAEGSYTLVDVKQAFETHNEKLINMVFSWGDIDPHPNKEGHKVIAEEIIPQISNFNK